LNTFEILLLKRRTGETQSPRRKKLAKVLPNPFPQKNRFSFCRVCIEALRTARISLRAEPRKEKCPFHFRKNHPRENQKSKEHFFFLGLPSEARRWRGDSLSVRFRSEPPRAPRVRNISDFGNKCELGTIKTPE